MTPEEHADKIVEHFSEITVDRTSPLNNVKSDKRVSAPLSILELWRLVTYAIKEAECEAYREKDEEIRRLREALSQLVMCKDAGDAHYLSSGGDPTAEYLGWRDRTWETARAVLRQVEWQADVNGECDDQTRT